MQTQTNNRRNDQQWIESLSWQDPGAIADLRDYLLKGLKKKLSNKAVSSHIEDFVQDSLIRILEKLPTFRGESQFTSWALSIANRIAFSELRRSR